MNSNAPRKMTIRAGTRLSENSSRDDVNEEKPDKAMIAPIIKVSSLYFDFNSTFFKPSIGTVVELLPAFTKNIELSDSMDMSH